MEVFSKSSEAHFGSPHKKDYSILMLGSIFEPPCINNRCSFHGRNIRHLRFEMDLIMIFVVFRNIYLLPFPGSSVVLVFFTQPRESNYPNMAASGPKYYTYNGFGDLVFGHLESQGQKLVKNTTTIARAGRCR